MNDLEILRELIQPNLIVEIQQGLYGKKMAELFEPQRKDNPCYSVQIQKIPVNSIIIRSDEFPAPEYVFNKIKGKGVRNRADFIIISQQEYNNKTENFIVFIELKRGLEDERKDIIEQLKGSLCVLSYFQAVGKIFWNDEDFLNPKYYNYRFVSIRDAGSASKRTLFNKVDIEIHDKPENMLTIMSPNRIEFKDLIYNPRKYNPKKMRTHH